MIKDRLELLRDYMLEYSLDAMIIPSNDPHFGEYIQDYYKCREWISGFNGSAATVVVTQKEAALWTDSRYFIQAEDQLSESTIELKKLKVPGHETMEQWLMMKLQNGSKIGIDQKLFSYSEYRSMIVALSPYKIVLLEDPFTSVWRDRPQQIQNDVYFFGEEFSGKSTSQKLLELIDQIQCKEDFVYISSLCDDIAWLCNIRGTDVAFNPLATSYALITKNGISLYCNKDKISDTDKKILNDQKICLKNYKSFDQDLINFPKEYIRIALPDKISVKHYSDATANGCMFIPDTTRGGFIAHLKAKKNSIEVEGFRKAYALDGVAWVKLLKYVDESFESNIRLTESDVSKKMIELRSISEYYRGESFEPIVAYASNAASPHYGLDEENPTIIKDGLLLIDVGAQYLYGTTDTTRTLCLGEPSKTQIEDYTAVLKGMINLSRAIFPKGTRGSSLDILARGSVCANGKLYLHGTGHGVGHFLCVHEGPQSIRMEENQVTIEPGMIQSNEPAIYVKNEYGIRIENLIACKEYKENEYGIFYNFETLTFVPIDTKAIDTKLLGAEELEWLNNYHTDVFNKLSPYLSIEEVSWLKRRTSCLN